MKEDDSSLWVFQVMPYDGESFGHYLGRFRRANCLSRQGLGKLVGVIARIVSYWETPSRRNIPSLKELTSLSELFGITIEQVSQMLPTNQEALNLRTRLCAGCYAQVPTHQKAWQEAGIDFCKIHGYPLLTECPACGTDFRIPALWETGFCEYCWLPFSEMGVDWVR